MAVMADSVKIVHPSNLKRVTSNSELGHIYKGHSIVAANASIPTKYQTIVTDNSDRKGFLRKAKRFEHEVAMTEAPAPGSHQSLKSVDLLSPSYSKRGTGSFASKSKRSGKLIPTGCGSGLYALPEMLNTRKDFNQSQVSRLFQKPIAQVIEKNDGIPSPNSYEVLKYPRGKANNVTANAAFKSKSRRELLNLDEQKSKPAPGQYSIEDNLLHLSAKVPFSSFKSTSKRDLLRAADPFPGPGAYDPELPAEPPNKLIFPRKHYLCISAPAMPLPSTPPPPGPGAYELRNFEDIPKHYMSSSAFVSTTGRWNNKVSSNNSPGPAHYRPAPQGKQSFIFNSANKWL